MKNIAKYFEKNENINIEPYRCYYIPFLNTDVFSYDRTESGKFVSLNGEWNIKKFNSFYDVPDDFLSEEMSEVIPVPSCVQFYGYDKMQYVNQWYPYPFDPPHVSNENPTYHYRKTVNIVKDGEDKFIVFEGVDSCFYLYLNGEFVGYSHITHKMTEFNITKFLKDGENVIDVLVLKWCANSYLEDQDKLRFTGIFRDVYILSRDVDRVDDYVITTDMHGNLSFKILKGNAATVTFCGQTKTAKPKEKVSFHIDDPALWSAETPNLYDLTVSCGNEIIYEQVGFKECAIKDGVLYFNGKPIKIYGVNRHDFNCETGATVTIENMVEDLTLMKRLNVNAIRTSHYPNAPEFYKLCDRFGFYVMSESDYETHGEVVCKPKLGYDVSSFGLISNMRFYEKAIVERQIANVKCNINRPCVYMWSLGNESGWGKNLVAAAKAVRKLDPTRGIHYEGIFYAKKEEYYTDLLDTASRMYPALSVFDEILKDEKETRPFILCEFSHSMGNGPGDICDYVNMFEKSDRFTGGFVWEWADHGIKRGDNEFLYGGDFNENIHDGNFCIDGIVSADRKFKRGTLEMKHAYQPIKFDYVKNYLILFNKNFFKPLKLKVVVSSDSEMCFDVEILPRETAKIRIVGKLFFNVRAFLEERGEEIANYTYVGQQVGQQVAPANVLRNDVTVTEKGRYISATVDNTEYVFDALSGEIASLSFNGEKITDYFRFNIVRAPVDNDRYDIETWKNERFFNSRSEVRKYNYENGTLTFVGNIISEQVCPIASYRLTYRFLITGLELKLGYSVNDGFSDLPRIGFCTELPSEYNMIEYFGYGEGETYIDMHESADFGYYTSFVDREYHHYVKPQESGSHYGTRKVQISSMDRVIEVSGDFSFSMLPYSVDMLRSKNHDFELEKSGKNYFSIDYFMSGVGSHSCGPVLQEKYRVPRKAKKSFIISLR